jgi:hypothetical protein
MAACDDRGGISDPGGDMNPRRGFGRLAIGLGGVWFVFWTVAYVLNSRLTETAAQPSLAHALRGNPVLVPACAVAAILLGTWIGFGFRAH